MKVLLENYNCDVNVKDLSGDQSLLYLAVSNDKMKTFTMMATLAKNHLDPNIANNDGQTPYGYFLNKLGYRDSKTEMREAFFK